MAEDNNGERRTYSSGAAARSGAGKAHYFKDYIDYIADLRDKAEDKSFWSSIGGFALPLITNLLIPGGGWVAQAVKSGLSTLGGRALGSVLTPDLPEDPRFARKTYSELESATDPLGTKNITSALMAAGTAGMTEKYMQAMGKDPTSVDWSKFENVKVPDISKISSDLKSSVLDIFDRGGTLDVDSLPVGAIDENIKFAGALPSGGNIATQDLFSLEKVRRAQEIMARRNRKDLY